MMVAWVCQDCKACYESHDQLKEHVQVEGHWNSMEHCGRTFVTREQFTAMATFCSPSKTTPTSVGASTATTAAPLADSPGVPNSEQPLAPATPSLGAVNEGVERFDIKDDASHGQDKAPGQGQVAEQGSLACTRQRVPTPPPSKRPSDASEAAVSAETEGPATEGSKGSRRPSADKQAEDSVLEEERHRAPSCNSAEELSVPGCDMSPGLSPALEASVPRSELSDEGALPLVRSDSDGSARSDKPRWADLPVDRLPEGGARAAGAPGAGVAAEADDKQESDC